MNLHKIVRAPLSVVQKLSEADLYVHSGRTEVSDDGDKLPVFWTPLRVSARFQSISADQIVQHDGISDVTTVRRVYLFADVKRPKETPWSMFRPLAKAGDYLQDDRGTFWFVDAILEDFTREGWVCVQAVMQTTPPGLILDDWRDGCDC